MKSLVSVSSRKGFVNPKGCGFKSSCAKQGKGIYQEMPIQRADIAPRVEPTMGMGLQTIKGSAPVPQKKDMSSLSSVLSSVSIGDRKRGRSKIKL